MEKRKEFWRALPFVMALLLLTLVPMQSASALFGKGKEEAKAVDGAPVAENMEIKVYRGVAYEGEFRAVDNEGDEVTFAIAQEPKKGTVALTEDGLGFVYTPGGKLGTDSFTYTAIDAYGNISLPATVSITIEKANSGVCYADMGGSRAHTAAVDLAEHGVFVGAKIGDSYFFEPERTLSRGEFVAMALAAMDVSAEDVQMTGFCDDASIPTWAKGYAVSALNAGVVSGVSTAEGVAFRANDAITLNEAAVVLNPAGTQAGAVSVQAPRGFVGNGELATVCQSIQCYSSSRNKYCTACSATSFPTGIHICTNRFVPGCDFREVFTCRLAIHGKFDISCHTCKFRLWR